MAARILRDITPKPVFSEDEAVEAAEDASFSSSSSALGADGQSGFIFSDDGKNSQVTSRERLRGGQKKKKKKKKKKKETMSVLQKKLEGIDVSLSAENFGSHDNAVIAGKSKIAAGKQKRPKKKGLRRADANVRYSIRSVR